MVQEAKIQPTQSRHAQSPTPTQAAERTSSSRRRSSGAEALPTENRAFEDRPSKTDEELQRENPLHAMPEEGRLETRREEDNNQQPNGFRHKFKRLLSRLII
ncbi:hypothetical protein KEM55_000085 [Ascosphaera atra]|nr:hypothetical protein KEM55_000085 [Ascosphaera atra]